MNNPFLSDRNIFSKVSNPVKKKSQNQKKEEMKRPQNTIKEAEINRQSYVTSYNYNNQEPKTFNRPGNAQTKPMPAQKMTFGVPNQEIKNYGQNFNNKSNAKPLYSNAEYDYQSSSQTNNQFSKLQSNPYENRPKETYQNRPKQTYQNRPRQTYQNRPRQRARISFQDNSSPASVNQDFPKSNHFDNYSPIMPRPSPKLNDSQFINIQAMGDDLNKFLAESKNQQELCKILGIQMRPKDKIMQRKTVNEGKIPYESEKYNELKPYESSNQQRLNKNPFLKPTPHVNQEKTVLYQKNQVFQSFKPNSKPEIPSQKSSKEYIPTFNYGGIQSQALTQSREYQVLPSFKKVDIKQSLKRPTQIQYQPLQMEQNLEVFNYSKVNTDKAQISLEQLINKQMMSLATSGKYRTFLTSSQKIITVRYKAEEL